MQPWHYGCVGQLPDVGVSSMVVSAMSISRPNRVQVFVSSTYVDLQEYRHKCIVVLDRLREELGMDWIGMEYPSAEGRSPLEESLKRVSDSDVYVGVFGMRYGSIDPDSDKSITELEYREARKRGLPCLIFIIDENRARVAPADVETGTAAVKLQQLKSEVRDLTKGHIVRSFTCPEDLASQLSVDLIKAFGMLGERETLRPLRDRIDSALKAGGRFICDMENRATWGWSFYGLPESNSWDTAYSMLALLASGEEDVNPQLYRGQQWLMAHRNRWGGWHSPWEPNPDASSTVDTAVALTALVESGYEQHPGETERTAAYLREAQCPSGGWAYIVGTEPAATAATAWAMRALVRAGYSLADEWGQRAIQWLMDNQRPDGGWGVDRASPYSTIGKTRDALFALALLGRDPADSAIDAAREWLQRARGAAATAEDFGRTVAVEPHGGNPLLENVVYLLEAAHSAGIPASDPNIRADLEWLAGRRWWGYTPQAVWCLSQYRKWVT